MTASRVEAVFEIESSDAFTDAQKRQLRARFGRRVTAVSQDSRSQLRNREIAVERLRERIAAALRPRKRRRPTKPSRRAKQRRLESKRRRSETKRQRGRPSLE